MRISDWSSDVCSSDLLHTLVQMVDNGLGLTMLPEMAIRNGILNNTDIVARPLKSEHAYRSVALVWRKNSPREKELRMLAQISRDAAQTVTTATAYRFMTRGRGIGPARGLSTTRESTDKRAPRHSDRPEERRGGKGWVTKGK